MSESESNSGLYGFLLWPFGVSGQTNEGSTPIPTNEPIDSEAKDAPMPENATPEVVNDESSFENKAIEATQVPEEKQTPLWRQPPKEGRDDLWVVFLRHVYFPCLTRYHTHICVIWLALLAISATWGINFLNLTRSDLKLPPNAPSSIAIDEFNANFPDASTIPPVFVVAHTNSDNVNLLGPVTSQLSTDLGSFATSYPDTISSVTGYYEFMSYQMPLLANQTVAENKRTMISTVAFKKGATEDNVKKRVRDLISLCESHTTPDYQVSTTGQFALFLEMQDATTTNFELIDATVLPIAILILGTRIRSYRHMAIAFINLICTLLLAFVILVPVTDTIAINPFAPSIMMSLGIAVCFDYSLFLLSRFQEEIVMNKKAVEDACFDCMAMAGHVIVLSGSTLFFTFALLIAFPQNFLQSVGWGCGAVVLTAIFANLTITPSLLLTCKCFSRFDMCPSTKSCCCYIAPDVDDVDTDAINHNSSMKELPPSSSSSSSSISLSLFSTVASPTTSTESALTTKDESTPPSTFRDTLKIFISKVWSGDRTHSFWFRAPWLITKHSFIALIIICGITAPFLYTFFTMVPTSDDALIYLRGSQSLAALQIMQQDFPLGKIDPYSIIMVTGTPGALLTSEYFAVENALVHELLDSQAPQYISTEKSLYALSYFQGNDLAFNDAMAFLSPNINPTVYNSQKAIAYRLEIASRMNTDKSAFLMTIETTVNPNSQAITYFIRHVRVMLKDFASTHTIQGKNIGCYLFGAYTTTLDVQEALYALVPTMIASTCAVVLFIVAMSFGSVFVAFRLTFTVFVSLAWTYGLMVLVYQPGSGQDAFAVLTPSILDSTGIYWIIPIMSFSILVGLALDYDIFLMSRMVEFRKMGWSDRASVCLAIQKTGGIITAAGVIMSVSFAGLLIPKSTVLNQYGFSLFIGVAFDTFIVRTVVGPICLTLFSRLSYAVNWWPSKMPAPLLSEKEEEEALFAGHWVPPVDSINGVVKSLSDISVVDAEGGGLEMREA